VEIAHRHDVTIIEDDVFGGLLDTKLSPLVSLSPERVVRLTGLSKTLGPGLRVGYLDVPAPMTGKIAAALHGTSWMASPLAAEVATRMITSGTAARILQENRSELARRNVIVRRILGHQYTQRRTPRMPGSNCRIPGRRMNSPDGATAMACLSFLPMSSRSAEQTPIMPCV
jgi:DNA-binding transcriptional MocR family regulator